MTDEWRTRGVSDERDYAILTDEMTKAWSGMSVREYKDLKNLKKENLRDNMTNIELVLNMLAEVTTTAISKEKKPNDMDGHKDVATQGGEVAKTARDAYESRVGNSAISSLNSIDNDKSLLVVNGKDDK